MQLLAGCLRGQKQGAVFMGMDLYCKSLQQRIQIKGNTEKSCKSIHIWDGILEKGRYTKEIWPGCI